MKNGIYPFEKYFGKTESSQNQNNERPPHNIKRLLYIHFESHMSPKLRLLSMLTPSEDKTILSVIDLSFKNSNWLGEIILVAITTIREAIILVMTLKTKLLRTIGQKSVTLEASSVSVSPNPNTLYPEYYIWYE